MKLKYRPILSLRRRLWEKRREWVRLHIRPTVHKVTPTEIRRVYAYLTMPTERHKLDRPLTFHELNLATAAWDLRDGESFETWRRRHRHIIEEVA